MTRLFILLFMLIPCTIWAQVSATVTPTRCGPCNAGYQWGGGCLLPGLDAAILTDGMTAAALGGRTAFDPDSYGGTDDQRLLSAMTAADALTEGTAAVVMDRVYVLEATRNIAPGVMVTGGGVRRKCSPTATADAFVASSGSCVTVDDTTGFASGQLVSFVSGPSYDDARDSGTQKLITVTGTPGATTLCHSGTIAFNIPQDDTAIVVNNLLGAAAGTGVIVDSVLFDGAFDCNPTTQEWTQNVSLHIAASTGVIVRNSIFYDSPAETIVSCDATFSDNKFFNIQGSWNHKSCVTEALTIMHGNYIDGVNLVANAIIGHAEGAFTFSNASGENRSYNNIYLNGTRAVWGTASANQTALTSASGDCYAGGFTHIIDGTGSETRTRYAFPGSRWEGIPKLWSDDP